MALIDVIDFHDETGENIVQRFPQSGEADVRLGTQVVVRESQVCIFYRGGQALDTFGPGRHTLSTANLPLLGGILKLPFGGKTPFKAECFYVNLKTFMNKKWGTKEPITFRDSVLKVVRLRAFGIMSYKVSDPQLFLNKVVGTSGQYTTSQINDFMRNMVVGRLTDVLGENLKTLLDLAALYDEIGIATKARISDDFAKYGLELEDMVVNAISPPPEVQAKIDERSGMGLFEDAMPQMQQYQMAYAMRDIAKNPGAGGMASAGMGMGMGLGMGFAMPGMMQQAMPGMMPQQQQMQPGMQPQQQQMQPGMMPQQQQMQPQQMAPAAAMGAAAAQPMGMPCANCQNPIPNGFKFCPGCGTPVQSAPQAAACVKCNAAMPAGTKFCPACGSPQEAPQPVTCGNCGQAVTGGHKFCANCGSPVTT